MMILLPIETISKFHALANAMNRNLPFAHNPFAMSAPQKKDSFTGNPHL